MFSKLIYAKQELKDDLIKKHVEDTINSKDQGMAFEQESPKEKSSIVKIIIYVLGLVFSVYGSYLFGYNKQNNEHNIAHTKLLDDYNNLQTNQTKLKNKLEDNKRYNRNKINELHQSYKNSIKQIFEQHKLELEIAPLTKEELLALYQLNIEEYNKQYVNNNTEMHVNQDTSNLTEVQIAQLKYNFAHDRYKSGERCRYIIEKAGEVFKKYYGTNQTSDNENQLMLILSDNIQFNLIVQNNYNKVNDAQQVLEGFQNKPSQQE